MTKKGGKTDDGKWRKTVREHPLIWREKGRLARCV